MQPPVSLVVLSSWDWKLTWLPGWASSPTRERDGGAVQTQGEWRKSIRGGGLTSEQDLEPLADFAMGDHSCDACVHAKVTCMWPTTGSLRQVCFGCQQSHGKCEIGGKPVTAQGLCKKCKVVSKATIEGDEDDVVWVPPPPAPKVAGTAESLFAKALASVVKDLKMSQKSLERIAQETLEVSRTMLSQTTALVNLVELVVQGKHFVRTCEMGWLESDGEELPVRWSRKGKGKAKEDESEEELEEDEEVEEKGEPEVEPEDVDMTLG